MIELLVEPDSALLFPQRLDRWLRRLFPKLSQSYLEGLLRRKNIQVNAQKVSSSFRVNIGDKVLIKVDLSAFTQLDETTPLTSAQKKQIEEMIIWEDEALCVINKPSGLAVQGGSGIGESVDSLFVAYGKNLKKPQKYHLVHRLDKETSGVLILAKSPATAHQVVQAFTEQDVQKTYWAMVSGKPSPAQGNIDLPLGKARGDYEKVQVDLKEGKPAQTLYRTLKTFKEESWIECKPLTGRKHQIRVHLSAIGCPIVGDAKYGGEKKSKFFLHAHQICLNLKGLKPLQWSVPEPDYWPTHAPHPN